MIKFKSLLMFLLLAPVAMAEPVPQSIIDTLSKMRVEKVTLDNSVLKIVSSEEKMYDLFAISAVDSVCITRFNGEPLWDKKIIKKITVLNHWEMQGFEFDIDGNDCDQYGKTPGDKANDFLRKKMKKA